MNWFLKLLYWLRGTHMDKPSVEAHQWAIQQRLKEFPRRAQFIGGPLDGAEALPVDMDRPFEFTAASGRKVQYVCYGFDWAYAGYVTEKARQA